QLLEMLSDLPCGIATTEALDFINRLTEARMVTRREGQLMKVALTQNVQVSEELLCITRTKLLIRMLEILLQDS
ncbi:MAG: hypothetical protein NUK65_00850, partial [Firmicutes bacterium]|nr:hypothetical protein [Bacillota bacterium]